jgi:hypothetical protein
MIFRGRQRFGREAETFHPHNRFPLIVGVIARRADRPIDVGIPIDHEHESFRGRQPGQVAQGVVAQFMQDIERKHPRDAISRLGSDASGRARIRASISGCSSSAITFTSGRARAI